MRVLVIDDEPDVLLLCRVNLVFEGHEVLEAADAPQGLQAAIAEKPDVIVLDIMLPNGSGLWVLRELQSRQDTRGIPVIMLTAKASGEDQVRGLEAGASLYLTKPFSPSALCVAAQRVAQMSPEERETQRRLTLQKLVILHGLNAKQTFEGERV